MKNKYIIAVLICGGILIIYGTLQKILHSPNADLLLKIGYGTVILSGILALLKILLFSKKDDFLNK